MNKLSTITEQQIKEKGVRALADRPNLTAQYGASGLTPAQLKLWFDKLATFLAGRINEIIETISSANAATYIRVCLDEYDVDNLGDLIATFTDGNFAEKILQVYPNAGAEEKQALQTVINAIAKQIADLWEEARAIPVRIIGEATEAAKESATATANSVLEKKAEIAYVDELFERVSAELQRIDGNVINEAHFRGYLVANADVQGLEADANDYAYSAESGTVWVYGTDGWADSGKPVPDKITPASNEAPPMASGAGGAGEAETYARGDHFHPTDTTRASVEEISRLEEEKAAKSELPFFVRAI